MPLTPGSSETECTNACRKKMSEHGERNLSRNKHSYFCVLLWSKPEIHQILFILTYYIFRQKLSYVMLH